MKKAFLISIFLIISISSIFANPIDNDCDYLETLLSDVSIDMSLSLDENNLTTQEIIDEIKSIYNNTASAREEKKSGIDKKAFASAINEAYRKYSKINGHAAVLSGNDFFVPFEHQFIFYSDLYFTKENDSYIVYKNYKNIKKGMRYTGNIDNLFKTIQNNQILYRYGIFSTKKIKNSVISIDNKDFTLSVYGNTGSVKNRKDYDFKKIDNCIYLKIEKCSYSDKNLEKQFFADSEKIITDFKNTDSIIFDFRNNLGGFSKFLNQFSYALIFEEKTKENENKFDKWNRSITSGHKRINTRTMINKTISVGLAPSNYINYCLENIDNKYLVEAEESVTLNPWYKGKIYIMINPLTCSAAEDFSLSLKKLFGDNVIIVGQNSNGSLDFTDVYRYILPDSRIQINLCAVDFRESNLLKEKCWHGDTKGIFPDYWCKPTDIVTILTELTGNKKLYNFIKM